MALARNFKELRVYRAAFEAAMQIFALTKHWPAEERYSLIDQIRRSSRAVTANVAEAWRKRLYVASFVSKLSDANAEAAETQVWLDYVLACQYIDSSAHAALYAAYDQVSGGLIKMVTDPEAWCSPAALREASEEYSVDSPGMPPSFPDDPTFFDNTPHEQ
jgi:four helix bundle protein